jgi:hypothetical protein
VTRYKLRGTHGTPATAPRYEQNALVVFPFQAIMEPEELGGTAPRDEVRTFVARLSLRTSTMEASWTSATSSDAIVNAESESGRCGEPTFGSMSRLLQRV